MKDETYYFHQTPEELCKVLIQKVPLQDGDIVIDSFKGEGNFYNNFPPNVEKKFCEIEEGIDYKDYQGDIDWIITNPPFRLEDSKGKRTNAFYLLLEYYSIRVRKGIAFLGNDYCLATLTPKRLKELQGRGLYLHNIHVCSVKKWRGRYFWMVFKKEPCVFHSYIEGNW